jgi:hypothetical protein
VDVDVLGELGQHHAAVPLQHGRHVGEAAVERVDHGVDLDAVARGDEHRLRDVLAAQHLAHELGHVARRDGGPLEHVDGGTAVGQPHDQHGHDDTSTGRSAQALTEVLRSPRVR